MPVAVVIERTRRVLKLGLPAVVGVLGAAIAVAVAGFLGIVPDVLIPVYDLIITVVTSLEGPVKFLLSLMAAVFAFLKFLKKDDSLTETCHAAAEILFAGYAANFLVPLRKVALKDKRLIIIAMPTVSFFADGDYFAEVRSRLKHLGISAREAGGKGAPSYWVIDKGKGKKSAILDIPRTLIGANPLAEQVKSDRRTSKKDQEAARRRLAEAFFGLLEDWSRVNHYQDEIKAVIPEKGEGAEALAGRIVALFEN